MTQAAGMMILFISCMLENEGDDPGDVGMHSVEDIVVIRKFFADEPLVD